MEYIEYVEHAITQIALFVAWVIVIGFMVGLAYTWGVFRWFAFNHYLRKGRRIVLNKSGWFKMSKSKVEVVAELTTLREVCRASIMVDDNDGEMVRFYNNLITFVEGENNS